MHRNLLLLFACLLPLSQTCAQFGPFLCAADTLYGLEWESVGGPPVHVVEYAQAQGRVFAATESGLFRSDNAGIDWSLIPTTSGKRILTVTATDSVVFYQTSRPVYGDFNTAGSSLQESFEIFRSTDLGETFSLAIQTVSGTVAYFGSSIPYENTRVFWLGGGAFSFRHGLPTNNGIQNNAFYFSFDYGKNWSVKTGDDDLKILTFCSDTLLNTTYALGPGGVPKTVYKLYTHPGILVPVASDTLDGYPGSATRNVYYRGDVYQFSFYNNTQYRVIIQRGYGQPGFPVATDTLTAVLPGLDPDEILYFSRLTSLDTVIRVETSKGKVFQAFISQPAVPILTGIQAPDAANLPAGAFRCDFYHRTQYSGDSGQSWQNRYRGLYAYSLPLEVYCGRPIAASYESFYMDNYFFQTDSGDWERVYAGSQFAVSRILGQAFDALYFVSGNSIRKTVTGCDFLDSDSVNGLPNDLKKVVFFQDKAYAFGNFSNKIWQSSDGINWAALTTGYFGEGTGLHRSGDSLLYVCTSRVIFSTDGGTNWQKRDFPPLLNSARIWIRGFNLYAAIGENLSSGPRSFFACTGFEQADDPAAWLNQCTLEIPYHSYFSFFGNPYAPETRSISSGVLFYHVQEGLYLTANGGRDWLRLGQLPFRNYYTYSQNSHGGGFAEFSAEGGTGYRIADGFLYAFTQRQGVLRTPAQPILDRLKAIDSSNAAIEPGDIPVRIFPNPSTGSINISLADNGRSDIRVYDAMGREVRAILGLPGGATHAIDLSSQPPGVYFCQINDERMGAIGTYKVLIRR